MLIELLKAETLKIICPHCGFVNGEESNYNATKIRTSKQVVATIREIYVDCQNPICLARFVMTLSHKHDLQPPLFKSGNADCVAHAIKDWTEQDKRKLYELFKTEFDHVS